MKRNEDSTSTDGTQLEDVVVRFTPRQFIETDEPYDYLAQIEDVKRQSREVAAYKKYAQVNCDISASAFRQELKKAEARVKPHGNAQEVPEAVNMTAFTGQDFALRCPGYYCNDSGIWKDGPYPVQILMHPMMPVARVVDYETHEHKTAIKFRIGDIWSTQIVSRDVLSSRAAFTKQMSLADAFVTSENCAGVITYMATVESANIDKLPVMHSTSRLGWHGQEFLPYESDLIFTGDPKQRDVYDSIETFGSEEVWYDFAKKVRANDWIIERCALAASFASVLLQPLKGTSFFVHIWADISGTGKTVAMMLGGSVWGNPRVGKYCQGMNNSNVGVEMMAGFLGNLPLCMDELCTRDRREGVEEMVYNYCLNKGRIRGSRNGGIQRTQTWCNCAITTGETPITSENSRAGMVNRILEIEASGKLFGGEAKQYAGLLNENYGFAGRRFIDALKQDGAWDEIRKYRAESEEELSKYATEKQFISMSLLLAADRFAAQHVFHDDNYLTVDDVKGFVKSDDDVDTNRRAYDWLMGTVAENNYMFEPVDEHYHGKVWGKLDERGVDDTVVCIIGTRLAELLKDQGYNSRSFLKWARRMGIVEADSEGKATKPIRLTSLGSALTRCACIRMNAFEKKVAPAGYTKVDPKVDEKPW